MFLKPPDERSAVEIDTVKWMFAVGFKFFKLCTSVSRYFNYCYKKNCKIPNSFKVPIKIVSNNNVISP